MLAKPPENHESFYWEHSDGRKAVRIVFDNQTDEILGFNLMGIRFRHEVCEKWLKEKTKVDEVMSNLKLANFDPEFYSSYEADIIGAFNKKYKRNVKLHSKGLLDQVYSFLKS